MPTGDIKTHHVTEEMRIKANALMGESALAKLLALKLYKQRDELDELGRGSFELAQRKRDEAFRLLTGSPCPSYNV
jgi:hypothetical protein